jgi:hypothetical protein
MISSGERSMPPSIALKISAVICGRSAVVRPAAFASSIGSLFSQLVRVRSAHAPRQLPNRVRRRISPLAGSNAFTEPLVIRFCSTRWQENSRIQATGHAQLIICKRQTLFSFSDASSTFANQSDGFDLRCASTISRTKRRKSPPQSAESFSRVCAPSIR